MTRAAQSIVANIVEGRGQTSDREFARFLGYSLNSASELEQHLITGHDIRDVPESEFDAITAQLTEVRKMIHGLRSRLAIPANG